MPDAADELLPSDPSVHRDKSGEQNKAVPRIINVGGKATILMGKGDRLVINTPGGGGWGELESAEQRQQAEDERDERIKVEWSARGSLVERAKVQSSF